MPTLALIKIGIVVAAIAAVLGGLWVVKEHYVEQGRNEVRAEWEAEKVAQKAARAAQEALWQAQKAQVEQTTRERDRERRERFAALQEQDRLAGEVASLRVPAAAVGVLQHSVDAANAAGTAAQPDGAAATTAASADADLGNIADWFREVARIHAECRDRVLAWNLFYSKLRENP